MADLEDAVGAMEEDNAGTDWLFDYMMNVFRSPSWEVPIMAFIDENCIIFDSEEENKMSYMDAHIQFKTLVVRGRGSKGEHDGRARG